MTNVQGMGKCTIPKDNNYPCGNQIQDGEPIGTVMNGSSALVGHKKCADEFYARKAAKEREAKNNMVKKFNQQGPQGPVDFAHPENLVEGATVVTEQSKGYDDPRAAAAAAGAHFLGDLPEDATPEQAFQYAQGGLISGGGSVGHLTDDDEAELAAYRQRLIERRRERVAREAPVTHNITLDLSQMPEEAQAISITLDLRKLRRG